MEGRKLVLANENEYNEAVGEAMELMINNTNSNRFFALVTAIEAYEQANEGVETHAI